MTQQGNILSLNGSLTNIESNFALIASEIRDLKTVTQPTDTANAISSLTTRVTNLESGLANAGSPITITYDV